MRSGLDVFEKMHELQSLFDELSLKTNLSKSEAAIFILLEKKQSTFNMMNALQAKEVQSLHAEVKKIQNEAAKTAEAQRNPLDDAANDLYAKRDELYAKAAKLSPNPNDPGSVLPHYISVIREFLREKGVSLNQIKNYPVVQQSQKLKLACAIYTEMQKPAKAQPDSVDDVAKELYAKRDELFRMAMKRSPNSADIRIVMPYYVAEILTFLKQKRVSLDQIKDHPVVKQSDKLKLAYALYAEMQNRHAGHEGGKSPERDLAKEAAKDAMRQAQRDAERGIGLHTQAGIAPGGNLAKEVRGVARQEHPDHNPKPNQERLAAANALGNMAKQGVAEKYREEYERAKAGKAAKQEASPKDARSPRGPK